MYVRKYTRTEVLSSLIRQIIYVRTKNEKLQLQKYK